MGKIRAKAKGPGLLTSFQAFATASGSTVGMGNIAGVSSAVALGGPGALFWMGIAALLGMALKLGEVTLGLHYREVFPDGAAIGGPTWYMAKGLGKERHWPSWAWKLLATMFGIGIFSTILVCMESYTIMETAQSTFNLGVHSTLVVGFVYMLFEYATVFGGTRRVAKFAVYAVPFMSILYIVMCLGVIIAKITALPWAIAEILKYAFTPPAAVGGFAGCTILLVFQRGVARGVFSNEAGEGTSPAIHASAKVDHPVRQGMWGSMEVFLDTIVLCTLTGLVVVLTGVWQSGVGGAGVVGQAFSMVYGSTGKYLLLITMIIFIFTSDIGWYPYYETMLVQLFGYKSKGATTAIKVLRYIYALPEFFFAAWMTLKGVTPAIVWVAADITTALPIYANLITIVVLSPVVFKLVRKFEEQYLSKEDAERKGKQ